MSNKQYTSFDQEAKDNDPENIDFTFKVDQFGDVKIMRYQVPGFDNLSLNQKKLVYYLSQAARCGRDIIFDQNMKHNLDIRKSLDNIVETFKGDRHNKEFENFMVYVKRFWFSNGFHHHYSSDKFFPDISQEYFQELINNSDKNGFPLRENSDLNAFSDDLMKLIFDKDYYPKGTSQNPDEDLIKTSAVNFYENLNKDEVEQYNKTLQNTNNDTPVSYGLNSKLIKENGAINEWVYKIDGLYGPAIKEIVKWLEKAAGVAENPEQQKIIEKLVAYYKTGDLKLWDEYNIMWVNDLQSHVDFINGFIETYSDPMGTKGTWESVVNFKDVEATKRTEIIAANAQWFEDHSPVDKRFKKDKVTGVSAKVITVAQLGGDCYPASPIGINLPNADWIRKEYGSKSVTMENITYAYDQVSKGNGMLEEFVYHEEDRRLSRQYGTLAGNLHTDLHECLGHGSGQLLEETSPDALENYASPLEEARADLFALYFMMDHKMLELDLLPTLDAAKAAYNSYIRNGLMTQLTRIETGKNIEQAHMRNRQLIAKWAFEKGQKENVIEKIVDNGKTYFIVNDHKKLRGIFGNLLAEIQRIKSEGDYKAGKNLIEYYAVQVDPELHKEVLTRFKKLNIAPYGGFMNPDFRIQEENGEIKDIEVTYPSDYTQQMLYYGKEYAFL
ncbi:MAG: dipeptidyl-peptidase 3 family protein [Bacteroidales bacterium]